MSLRDEIATILKRFGLDIADWVGADAVLALLRERGTADLDVNCRRCGWHHEPLTVEEQAESGCGPDDWEPIFIFTEQDLEPRAATRAGT